MDSLLRKNGQLRHRFGKRDGGFSLIELLIAMAVGLIALGAMYGVFNMHRKALDIQEQIAEMQQSARAAMEFMSREIRMAGYNPHPELNPTGVVVGIQTATSSSLTFSLDIRGDNEGDPPDGDTGDSNEYITYSLYTPEDGIQKLGRRSAADATFQPVAEHIQSLTFQYWDANGNTTATAADIRRIQVTIVARTAKPDPGYTPNSGYRTYTLTSVIDPRNLGL
jgi:type IV pilus assembly protein PilW